MDAMVPSSSEPLPFTMAPDNQGALTAPVRRHDVPNEILLLIFRQLRKEDLKSTRLVCKLWSSLPVGLLFDRVYISPHSVNVEVFNSIAAHPVISRCVRELVYDVCAFREDLTKTEYFRRLCHQVGEACRFLPSSRCKFDSADEQVNEFLQYAKEYYYSLPPPDGKKMARMGRYRFVDRGHRAYVDHARQQQEWDGHGQLLACLCMGLGKLPALNAIVLGKKWVQYMTVRDFKPSTLQPVHVSGSPLARTWHPLFLEPEIVARRFDEHLEFFTVMRALSLSQKKILTLKSDLYLPLYTAIFESKSLMSPWLLGHTINALSEVKKLSLRRLTSSPAHDTNCIDALPAILQSMKALTHLHLDVDKELPNDTTLYTLSEIVGCHYAWPHLSSLKLGAFAADEANLVTFLVSLRALQALRLRDVELTSGSWASAIDRFRRSLRLQSLSIRAPLREPGGVTVRDEDDWEDLENGISH